MKTLLKSLVLKYFRIFSNVSHQNTLYKPKGFSTKQMTCQQRDTVAGKSKLRPRTAHEGTEGEKNYSSILSLTSALDGGEVINAKPRLLYPGKKDPVSIVQNAEWVPGTVWTDAKSLDPLRTVAGTYAIPAQRYFQKILVSM